MKSFREWLKIRETMTSTASVAHYAMPIGAAVTRMYPEPITVETDPFFKRGKKKRKKILP